MICVFYRSNKIYCHFTANAFIFYISLFLLFPFVSRLKEQDLYSVIYKNPAPRVIALGGHLFSVGILPDLLPKLYFGQLQNGVL